MTIATELIDEVRRLRSRVSELEDMVLSSDGKEPRRDKFGSEASTGLRSSRSVSPPSSFQHGSSSSSSVCGVNTLEQLKQLREALADGLLHYANKPREPRDALLDSAVSVQSSSPVRRRFRADDGLTWVHTVQRHSPSVSCSVSPVRSPVRLRRVATTTIQQPVAIVHAQPVQEAVAIMHAQPVQEVRRSVVVTRVPSCPPATHRWAATWLR